MAFRKLSTAGFDALFKHRGGSGEGAVVYCGGSGWVGGALDPTSAVHFPFLKASLNIFDPRTCLRDKIKLTSYQSVPKI